VKDRPVVDKRESLRPPTIVVLTLDHESEYTFEWRRIALVTLGQVHSQEKKRSLGRSAVVKRRVAVIVVELLQAPTILANRVVPASDGIGASEVVQVIPPSGPMLRANKRRRHLGRRLVVILVAGHVITVEKEMTNRRGPWRLDPDHRRICLHLTPAS